MSKEDSRDSLLHDASFQDDLRTALKRAISARLPSATANSARRGQSPPPSSSSSGKSQQSLQAPQRKRKPEESYEDLLKSYNDLTSSKRCANFASKKKKKKNEVPSKDEDSWLHKYAQSIGSRFLHASWLVFVVASLLFSLHCYACRCQFAGW